MTHCYSRIKSESRRYIETDHCNGGPVSLCPFPEVGKRVLEILIINYLKAQVKITGQTHDSPLRPWVDGVDVKLTNFSIRFVHVKLQFAAVLAGDFIW